MNRLPPDRRIHHAEAGFTLVEIMVVIVIIGLLAALVAPNVLGMSEEAKITKAQTDVRTISEAAKLYRIKNNRIPTIEDLTTPDEKGHAYIDDESVAKDPWDHEYMIKEGDRPGTFVVVSSGPNGSEGDEDDITSKPRQDR
jgi:general secretion pathway protein G